MTLIYGSKMNATSSNMDRDVAMWIPPEDMDPVVLQEPTRKSIGVIGAVRISDGCLVTSQEKTFNSMTFLHFMEKLLPFRKPDRKMVVVLDNARWHHAKALTPWLTELKTFSGSIIFLPIAQT